MINFEDGQNVLNILLEVWRGDIQYLATLSAIRLSESA